jgi:single-strand DNA-binding protein
VYIEGRLQTRQWEKDGVKHYTTEIVGDEMQMLDRAGEASASAGPRQNSGGYAPSPAPAPSPRGGDQDRYYGAPEPAPARQPQQAPQYPDPAFNRHADDGFDDDIPF